MAVFARFVSFQTASCRAVSAAGSCPCRRQPAAGGAPAIDSREAEALVAALKPPKRQRPVIAILGINDATETTDYLMPVGILRRASRLLTWAF